jgi:hypothetical protein
MQWPLVCIAYSYVGIPMLVGVCACRWCGHIELVLPIAMQHAVELTRCCTCQGLGCMRFTAALQRGRVVSEAECINALHRHIMCATQLELSVCLCGHAV